MHRNAKLSAKMNFAFIISAAAQKSSAHYCKFLLDKSLQVESFFGVSWRFSGGDKFIWTVLRRRRHGCSKKQQVRAGAIKTICSRSILLIVIALASQGESPGGRQIRSNTYAFRIQKDYFSFIGGTVLGIFRVSGLAV
jgi:hypothetical protein